MAIQYGSKEFINMQKGLARSIYKSSLYRDGYTDEEVDKLLIKFNSFNADSGWDEGLDKVYEEEHDKMWK